MTWRQHNNKSSPEPEEMTQIHYQIYASPVAPFTNFNPSIDK